MGRVFGGYTNIPWTSIEGFKGGNGKSFIFSLRNDDTFVKLRCLDNYNEVYHSDYLLCGFGESSNCGFDLFDRCNKFNLS